MPKTKIAVSLETAVVKRIDRLVREGAFPNRSQAVEVALQQQLARLDRGRLARQCARLDPEAERAVAEEGLAGEVPEWPAY